MRRDRGLHSLRDSAGYSLVELLLALAISSFVMVLLVNALVGAMFFQKTELVKQQQLDDVRFVSKMITTDLRKADSVKLNGSLLQAGAERYELVDDRIERNGEMLASSFEKFSFSLNGRMLTVAVATETEESQQQAWTTKILIREGVPIVQGP